MMHKEVLLEALAELTRELSISSKDFSPFTSKARDLLAEHMRDRLTAGTMTKTMAGLAFSHGLFAQVGVNRYTEGPKFYSPICRMLQASLKFAGFTIGGGGANTSAMLMAITKLFTPTANQDGASSLLREQLEGVAKQYSFGLLAMDKVPEHLLQRAEEHACRSFTNNSSVIDQCARRAYTLGLRLRDHDERDEAFRNAIMHYLKAAVERVGFAGGFTDADKTRLPEDYAI